MIPRDPITDLKRFAEALTAEVPEARAHAAVFRARQTQPRGALVVRRIVLATGMAVFLNIGLAAAANPSIPGELLYPIDRAYERLTGFFGVDHRGERIHEAAQLAGSDRQPEAIQLLMDTLGDESPSQLDSDLGSDLSTALESSLQADRKGEEWTAFREALDELITAAQQRTDTPAADDAVLIKERAHALSEAAKNLHPRTDSPSATAPGQTDKDKPKDNPSLTAPGQGDDGPPKENPSQTAPGRPD